MRAVRVAVLGAVFLLTACVREVGGTAMPIGVEPATEDLTAEAFGNLGTIDPCGLTGPAATMGLGTARMPGTPSLDECRVTVATDEGHVYVRVGSMTTEDRLPEDRQPVFDPGRGASIVSLPKSCEAALILADGLAVTATTTLYGDGTPSESTRCGLAQGAARGVFDVLASGRVRHWTPEENSLATVSACDVLSAHRVAERLDLPSERPTPYPAGHRCRWGRPATSPVMTLEFRVGESAADIGVPAGVKEETLGGRRSWVVPPGRECVVVTEHLPFALGAGLREYIVLQVIDADTDGCDVVREFATTSWPELPPSD
jgi:hypothetical protein